MDGFPRKARRNAVFPSTLNICNKTISEITHRALIIANYSYSSQQRNKNMRILVDTKDFESECSLWHIEEKSQLQ